MFQLPNNVMMKAEKKEASLSGGASFFGLFVAEDFDNAGVLGVDGNAVGLEVVEVEAEVMRWAAGTHQPPSEEMMTL